MCKHPTLWTTPYQRVRLRWLWRCREPHAQRQAEDGRPEADRPTQRSCPRNTGADGLKLALALLWEQRTECPGTVPVLVCHDDVVIECAAEQAADAKAWLEKAMIEGMDTVLNSTAEAHVPVGIEARIVKSWVEEAGSNPLKSVLVTTP